MVIFSIDWYFGATSPGPSLAVVVAISRLHGLRGVYAAVFGHGLGVFSTPLLRRPAYLTS